LRASGHGRDFQAHLGKTCDFKARDKLKSKRFKKPNAIAEFETMSPIHHAFFLKGAQKARVNLWLRFASCLLRQF